MGEYRRPKVSGFYTLETDAHAYWLGFLAADGAIAQCLSRVDVTLEKGDAGHLEKLRVFLDVDNPIKPIPKRNAVLMVVYSRELVAALVHWGIVPAKSLIFQMPQIPSCRMRAFLRGYFDGDGTLHLTARRNPQIQCRFTSGSHGFLVSAQRVLHDDWGIWVDNPKKDKRRENTWFMSIGAEGSNIERFHSALYDNASVFLDRKHQYFLDALNPGSVLFIRKQRASEDRKQVKMSAFIAQGDWVKAASILGLYRDTEKEDYLIDCARRTIGTAKLREICHGLREKRRISQHFYRSVRVAAWDDESEYEDRAALNRAA